MIMLINFPSIFFKQKKSTEYFISYMKHISETEKTCTNIVIIKNIAGLATLNIVCNHS